MTDGADPLNNPVWAALTTGNRDLAVGGPLAWRYEPDVAPFAAVADATRSSFEALARLVPVGARMALVTVDQIDPPAPLVMDRQAPILQMILPTPIVLHERDLDCITLSADDVADMLSLAEQTRPGPFGVRTIDFGAYFGVRIGTALGAMVGERMRFDRFVEISAVCVDEKHRGKGLASLLVTKLAQRIQEHGSTPFLHVFTDNARAIELYEKLGFFTRRTLYVTVLRAS